jgi:predicted DNA-binding transcriptional regulator AlpA
MRFLLFKQLQPEKGIPYSDRQLKRLEAKGTFPKRVPLAGGSIKGWPEIIIDQHMEELVELSRTSR